MNSSFTRSRGPPSRDDSSVALDFLCEEDSFLNQVIDMHLRNHVHHQFSNALV